MALGRISGPLLKDNLLRDRVNLRFEDDLLYLLVSSANKTEHKVGIKNSNPLYTLDVNGTSNATKVKGDELEIDLVKIDANNITTLSNELIISAGSVNDRVRITRDVRVEGNLHATGNITADGSLTFGDSNTDNIVFNADVNSDIVPDVDDTYNLGSLSKSWKEIYVDDMRLGGPETPDSVFVQTSIPGAGDTADKIFVGLADPVNFTKISNTNTNGHLALSANGLGLIELVSTTRIHNDLNVLGDIATDNANYILVGEPVYGLLDGAVEMTTDTSLTDGVAQLNQVLTLLVPPSPPDFPNAQQLIVQGLEQRIINELAASQSLNGNTITAPAAGTVVWVARVNSFSTSIIEDTGPGTTGNVSVIRNTNTAVTKRLTFGSTTQSITSKFIATTNASDGITYDQPKVGVLAIGYLIKTGASGAFGGLSNNSYYYIKAISAKVIKLANYNAVTGTIGTDFIATSTATGTLTFEAFPDNGDFVANNTTLKVTNNVASPLDTPGFFETVDLQVTGINVPPGWNTVQLTHSGISPTASTTIGSNTSNVGIWYYDDSIFQLPVWSNQTFTLNNTGTSHITESSRIPHYNNTTVYDLGFTLNWNPGKTAHNSTSFSILQVSTSAGGVFSSPGDKTYTNLGYTTLPNTLQVNSGTSTSPTPSTFKVNIISGFGIHLSSANPQVPKYTAYNSYGTADSAFPSLGKNILYKTGTSGSATFLEETNIGFHTAIGSEVTPASRCLNPDGGTANQDTPDFSTVTGSFVSNSSTLLDTDATVVANVLAHDVTDYTNYLPAGPNLNTAGRTGAQYFTFKFSRDAISKFSITYTTNTGVAAIFCAMPGTGGASGTTSTLNKWLDLRVDYSVVGGNGCALGGNMNPSATGTKTYNCSFGTLSSANATNKEIWVRIKLTAGQKITRLTIGAATA